MDNNVHISVDKKEFDLSFACEESCRVIINGKSFDVEELKSMGQGVFGFLVNSRLHEVELEFTSDGLMISMDGLTYEVKITDPTQQLLNRFIKHSGKDAISEGLVKAPMPGIVVKHFCEVGDKVTIGDKLVIVEAMKMENLLKAPVGGIVKTIRAGEGTVVEKNALIIEIEPQANN